MFIHEQKLTSWLKKARSVRSNSHDPDARELAAAVNSLVPEVRRACRLYHDLLSRVEVEGGP